MQIVISCFVNLMIFFVSTVFTRGFGEDREEFLSLKILFHNEPMEGCDHCECGHVYLGHPLAIQLLNGKKERKHVNVEAKRVQQEREGSVYAVA